MTLRALACLLLLSSAASAQNLPPAETWSASIPGAVESVTVSANARGPAIWRVRRGGSELWILGTVGPMPETLVWNKDGLTGLVGGARQVLFPPVADAGLVDMAWFYLWHGDLLRQPRGQTLLGGLPEGLRARFTVLARAAGQTPERYDGDMPLIAAMRLSRDFLEARKLSRDQPRDAVEKLARRARVKTAKAGEFDLMPVVREVLALPPGRQRPCLEQAVADIERQARDAVPAAEAWADGDVAQVKAHYAESKLLECIAAAAPGAQGLTVKAGDILFNALDAALKQPGKSVAVIGIGPLLRKGGVLERLAASGAVIDHPPE